MRHRIIDYLRLMRIPGAIGMVFPLIFGAISVNNFSLSVIGPLSLIGLLSGIYGFMLNDYIDVDIDKQCPELAQRALVRGIISKKVAKFIIISCFLSAYALLFIFFFRHNIYFYTGLVCLIIADILAGIYNIRGKKLIGSDFLLALGQSLYFLFGAFMAITTWSINLCTWMLFILIFLQLLYNNAVIGGLKDAYHDNLMKVRNIALASGVTITKKKQIIIPTGFKAFGIDLRALSIGLIFVPLIYDTIVYTFPQIIALVILSCLLLYTCVHMLFNTLFDRTRLRKLIMIQLFIWYTIIPIMLVSIIGWLYGVLLLVVPTLWYIFFSLIIGQKIFAPEI